MHLNKWGIKLIPAVLLFVGALACRTGDMFIAQATATPTRPPRPTFTPIPPPTDTPVPTDTSTPEPTATATRRPAATRKPVVPTPKPAPQATPVPQPTVSPYEFHANAPAPCTHAGNTYLKGTVYLDRNDSSQRYAGAIVALGPPDGSTIYTVVKADDYGEYTFTLSAAGQPPSSGTWAIWLVDPSYKRKSDISGMIVTNGLPASDPTSCWTSGVDFWK